MTKGPSDCDLILNALADGEWYNAIELHRTVKPGCVNWALRSRISDLKRKGYEIESRIDANKQAAYRLVSRPGGSEQTPMKPPSELERMFLGVQ